MHAPQAAVIVVACVSSIQIERAQPHGHAGVLAAPLMDVSHLIDTANLLSPSGSNTVLPAVSSPSADALTLAAAGPSPRGPATPLLIAVGPSKPLMAPDLRQLFSLYYHDQTKPVEPKLATTQ